MLGSSGSVARLPAEAADLGRLRFRGDLCDLPKNGLGVPQGRCHCFCSGITGVRFSSLLLQMRPQLLPFWDGSGGSEPGLETVRCHSAPGDRSLHGRASCPQM